MKLFFGIAFVFIGKKGTIDKLLGTRQCATFIVKISLILGQTIIDYVIMRLCYVAEFGLEFFFLLMSKQTVIVAYQSE